MTLLKNIYMQLHKAPQLANLFNIIANQIIMISKKLIIKINKTIKYN